MNLLLKDAKAPIAEVLNMDKNDPRVVRYINEAIEVILQTHDWVDTRRLMSFVAYNGALTLPPHVIVPLKFKVDGITGEPYGPHYEYASGGPGEAEQWPYTARNMVDAGLVPTMFDIDNEHPTRLSVWSDAAEEFPYTVWIRGLDEDGHEVRQHGGIGETLTWVDANADNVQETDNQFSRITQVVKTSGKGYVNIAVRGDTGIPERIVTCMHPDETSPSLRRFVLHGIPPSDTEGFCLVKGLFRIGYSPAIRDNDALMVTIIHALKLMVKSVLMQEHEEPNKAAVLEGQVERILTNQANQYDTDDNIIDYQSNYDMSDVAL